MQRSNSFDINMYAFYFVYTPLHVVEMFLDLLILTIINKSENINFLRQRASPEYGNKSSA